MQVVLDIPDMIPQEIVNRLLTQWRNQLQIEEKLAAKSSLETLSPAQSLEMQAQLKIGREFMQNYHETFTALAK
jgi:uncharacterized protein with von Willebrand factor type A (vWA) domain